MMSATVAQFTFIRPGESPELGEDIRQLFEDLAAHLEPERRAVSGACHPALDVFEHDDTVEIVMDAAGLRPDAVRILFRTGLLIVAGEKAPLRVPSGHEFHLIEREFGRFARAVRVTGAFDVPAATATLRDGELSIVLPKRTERRGAAHTIRVADGTEPLA
jgi:HSP20 family protein